MTRSWFAALFHYVVAALSTCTLSACQAHSATSIPTTSDAGAGVYSFPGCPDAEGSCGSATGKAYPTLQCALDSLQQSYGSCSKDSDCVGVKIDGSCSGLGECFPYVVADAGAASFKVQAQAEIDRYCRLDCGGGTSGSCPGTSTRYICNGGRCQGAECDGGSECPWPNDASP